MHNKSFEPKYSNKWNGNRWISSVQSIPVYTPIIVKSSTPLPSYGTRSVVNNTNITPSIINTNTYIQTTQTDRFTSRPCFLCEKVPCECKREIYIRCSICHTSPCKCDELLKLKIINIPVESNDYCPICREQKRRHCTCVMSITNTSPPQPPTTSQLSKSPKPSCWCWC